MIARELVTGCKLCLVGFLVLPVAASAQERWFDRQQFSASAGGDDLAVGDFDGDGKADIVTSGGQFLRGDGHGSFAPAQDFLGGTWAPGGNCNAFGPIAAGDVNADGREDVVLVGSCLPGAGPQPILCCLGSSTAPPQPLPLFTVPRRPACARFADMDGDGNADLVTSTALFSFGVSVLRGNGDGTFQTGVDIPLAQPPVWFSIADVNADGNLDVVTTNGLALVSVLLGNGSGSLTLSGSIAVSPGGGATGVATGDVDGDGDIDIVTADGSTSTASLLLGDGTGAFVHSSQVPVGTGPTHVELADTNADGRLDIVTTNGGSFSVSVALGVGSASFAAATSFETCRDAKRTALFDFDGDGRIDMAAISAFSRAVTIQGGDGAGGFTPSPAYHGLVNHPRTVAAGDLNGDGHVDLVTGNQNVGSISVLLGTGTGSLSSATTLVGGSSPWLVDLGDFDGNGALDVVVANVDVWTVTVYLGDGLGGFTSVSSYGLGVLVTPNDIATGDFNGDGRCDVVTRSLRDFGTAFATTITVLLADPTGALGAPVSHSVGGASSYPGLAVGDVDADGDLDVVTAGMHSPMTLRNNGTGVFTLLTSLEYLGSVGAIALADLDGDGKLDLAAAAEPSLPNTRAAFAFGDGTGQFGPATFLPMDSKSSAFAVRDMNADGVPDLVAANGDIDSISILQGDGAGGFLAAQRFSVPWNPRAIAIEDFNGDGMPDIAVVSGTSGFPAWRMSILENRKLAPTDAAAYCFGDGTGTACPCGNTGASGHGCPSSVDASGALLVAQGQARIGHDDVVLTASMMPTTTTALFYQGTLRTNGGAGFMFGDGLRCASGFVVRLKAVVASSGSAHYPGAGDASVSARGNVTAPGSRTYQAWYRNAATFCTASTFNLTNGLEVMWAP